MPAKKLCIHKNVKRKAKAMSIQNTIIVIIFLTWYICLKLETVHKLIESKK